MYSIMSEFLSRDVHVKRRAISIKMLHNVA